MTSILRLAKLQRKLTALPKVARDMIRAAMEKQADIIVAMMKSLVPVDRGELRDSIGWTWGKAPKGSYVVAVVKASLGGDLTLTIFAGNEVAYYARWQEHGTQEMPAQPYFFVSWRANKKGSSRAIRAAVNKAAKQVAAS
ncbi:HK97 gp10 family phage protein [Mesorhizobium sp. M7A.F.Ca.CA.001.07.2.1]|nr:MULTISPECIES: HK97-gp10 family putative phage morphogenesis protein [unclassified Mesorhizobium]MCF6126065.1 HK97 gp10 family phage protein [Mesorhizobium ciceri]RUX89468.1 HK97 gp10 family phage protein [Mesorhizobium sp. M7A.F.Ca.CA.004.08.1.1]RUY84706.1 HK97 gp10 family phage protein [Mesorhizobium sp. M7A.F.Ca.CA.001.10.2.1]RVA20102.1 HK97 gp10 family phage protein [Mesorhizobium sp. M7A.F.Ca.CA.002.05.1.1]RVA42599.1 HK97 gp10 family phage protein [Mesorhizobium sp. M7A.F.Ca.CA.004.10.1